MEQHLAQTWRLTNAAGISVRIGAIGAAFIAIETPDRDGKLANIVLSLGGADAYRVNPDYLGVVVGRFANRISGARFDLDGHAYPLDANDGQSCLHGGRDGWHKRAWQGDQCALDDAPAVRLALTSPDGDGGFPGRVDVSVTYALTNDGRLIIDYCATSDAPTPFSPTQHSYWNLSGRAGSSIADHKLSVAADHWLPVDSALLPCAAPAATSGTPWDFSEPQPLGVMLARHTDALRATGGYDHCLLLRGNGLREVARLAHPPSGRAVTVCTDRPAMQLYTGQHLGPPYGPLAGVALETQMPPDAPNRPELGNCILRPGASFTSRTIYAFANS